MKLRKLKAKDAPFMLEWMHDFSVVHYLRKDFASMTEDDCIRFIANSQDETESLHLTIVDDHDEYMGTVSLKHIQQNTAEFGIVLRSIAMGRGYGSFGMREIIKYGYKTQGINTVYWCVDPENQRAVYFYETHNYQRCNAPDHIFGYTNEEKRKYIWYHLEIKQ